MQIRRERSSAKTKDNSYDQSLNKTLTKMNVWRFNKKKKCSVGGHLTVVCSVTWPINASENRGDHALI